MKIRITVEGQHILCLIKDWEKLKKLVERQLLHSEMDEENANITWEVQECIEEEREDRGFGGYTDEENANFAWQFFDDVPEERNELNADNENRAWEFLDNIEDNENRAWEKMKKK